MGTTTVLKRIRRAKTPLVMEWKTRLQMELNCKMMRGTSLRLNRHKIRKVRILLVNRIMRKVITPKRPHNNNSWCRKQRIWHQHLRAPPSKTAKSRPSLIWSRVPVSFEILSSCTGVETRPLTAKQHPKLRVVGRQKVQAARLRPRVESVKGTTCPSRSTRRSTAALNLKLVAVDYCYRAKTRRGLLTRQAVH